jgi:alkylation response protein AidB-like acyl-CoA dehydrogenase
VTRLPDPGPLAFTRTDLTPEERGLQQQVRAFLSRELAPDYRPGLGMNAPADRDFSRRLAGQGWLGMALPKEYGGGERSTVERCLVTEELLSVGAPVAHHWIADRQSAGVIYRFGSEAQRQRFLPAISRGELGFSIGMSEPGSGSDLASVRCRAVKADGGWRLTGTKIWTTGAHRNDWVIALFRTGDEGDRHAGLSQFLVDLHSPDLQINPIPFLDGTADFNEVVFDEVFVPDELLLGAEGEGWAQNTAELAFERGGVDRYLSTYPVLAAFLRETAPDALDVSARRFLGHATAQLWVFRQLSLALARTMDGGQSPVAEAALVKEMGVRFEQDVLVQLQRLTDVEPSPDSPSLFERLLSEAVLTTPGNSIRGGTNEILRSVITKAMGGPARPSSTANAPDGPDPDLLTAAEELFTTVAAPDQLRLAETTGWLAPAWAAVSEMGLPGIGVAEAVGGQGGRPIDALGVLRLAGAHALPLPLAESWLAGGLLEAAGIAWPDGVVGVIGRRPGDDLHWIDGRLTGTAKNVAWARSMGRLATLVGDDSGWQVAVFDTAGLTIDQQVNLAGEPRDTVHFAEAAPEAIAAADGLDPAALWRRGALTRVVLMAGALTSLYRLTLRYTGEREQFGRPIGRFQAVQEHLVHIAQQTVMATMAADLAERAYDTERERFAVAAGRTVVGEAATIATAAAHQAHGAIGMTQEYALQFYSRRLWSWAREWGSNEWPQRVGDSAIAAGADGLFSLIQGGNA